MEDTITENFKKSNCLFYYQKTLTDNIFFSFVIFALLFIDSQLL